MPTDIPPASRVLVLVDPPGQHEKMYHREVEFFDDWKSALDHVTQIAQGDDPGTVTILTLPTGPYAEED